MGVLLLVRHGQASFGADDYDVLSPTGWEQGRTLGRWLAQHGPVPAGVVHGGMRRHRETWEAIAEGAGSSSSLTVHVDADWAEFDHLAVLARYGELSGHTVPPDADRRAFQAHFEQATEHWTTAGPRDGYPESWDGFAERTARALAAASERPGTTLVVTSGGVIAALAAGLVLPGGVPRGPTWSRFNTVCANTSVTKVIVGATGARLLTFNEHPHLAREMVTYR